MTRPRRPRSRVSGPFDGIRLTGPIEYSPERWNAILDAVWFGGPPVPKAVRKRALELLDEWRDQQRAYEAEFRARK
jgi:hypothetical protein